MVEIDQAALRALAGLLLLAYILFTHQWIILVAILLLFVLVAALGGLIG